MPRCADQRRSEGKSDGPKWPGTRESFRVPRRHNSTRDDGRCSDRDRKRQPLPENEDGEDAPEDRSRGRERARKRRPHHLDAGDGERRRDRGANDADDGEHQRGSSEPVPALEEERREQPVGHGGGRDRYERARTRVGSLEAHVGEMIGEREQKRRSEAVERHQIWEVPHGAGLPPKSRVR